MHMRTREREKKGEEAERNKTGERVKTRKRGRRGERRKERVTENSSRDGNNFCRERDRVRMGARAREIGRRRRRSSPLAREGARRRERNGREGGEVLLPPLLVTEIPSRERERGGERGKRSSRPASPHDGNSVSLSLSLNDCRPRWIDDQSTIDRCTDPFDRSRRRSFDDRSRSIMIGQPKS